MDLQTRKLNLIEYLIGINDENAIVILEEAANKTRGAKGNKYLPFTEQEIIDRAKESNEDYRKGKVIDSKKLEAESENW